MAISDYKLRIKKLSQKINEIVRFTHPVGFFNSNQEKEKKVFSLKNPQAILLKYFDIFKL